MLLRSDLPLTKGQSIDLCVMPSMGHALEWFVSPKPLHSAS